VPTNDAAPRPADPPIDRDAVERLITERVDERVNQALAEHEERNDPLTRQLIHGDESRLHVDPSAVVNNALFNLSSGEITVGADAIFGHGVSILTGTHDVNKFGSERKQAIPREGRDIVIEEGAWVASNATVLGPSNIGEHAVVAAGALVQGDVEPYAVVAGVPAKEIKRIQPPQRSDRDAGES
jgi:acetyltransferase-like isoleucine patch superfamily enzyme